MTGDLVLVTGASGVVGRAVLEELPAERVVCLVHREPVADRPSLVGDLSAPQFGWAARTFDAVAEQVGVVVHCGALTEWGLPPERYAGPNVEGTRTVVELARRAGAPVQFVSTAFVAALDGPPLTDDNVVAPYIRSKRAAERVLADSVVPHSIHRPTNLVGHSADGHTSRGQIIQTVADWILRGRATVFPAAPGNRVDIAPQDFCAVPVARGALARTTGDEFWTTTGPQAMSTDEALEVLREHADGLGGRFVAPRVVDPADLTADDLAAIPPLARRFLRVLVDVSEITAACGGVLPTTLSMQRERYGLPEVADHEALRRTLRAAAPEAAPATASETAGAVR